MQEINIFGKCLISVTETQGLQNDLKELIALVPTNQIIQITLDYLANDPELQKIFAYYQSEVFPKIHRVVEYLQQYKEVSAFM